MNSTIPIENSSTQIIESWFIPIDIIRIICNVLAVILALIFLFTMILDKTCHTIPMLLVGNSCLIALILECDLLGNAVFILKGDLQQIQDQDLFCDFRGYLGYCSLAIFNYSFLLQALYRYVIVVYPARLFWQSSKNQILLICITWIFGCIFPIPTIFIGGAVYNIDNQICQVPLGLSLSVVYLSNCIYFIPVMTIMFIYVKLVLYIKAMSRRITPVNVLSRAQRELKMVQRTVVQVSILVTLGLPYSIFLFISFFINPPKYHFRIAYIFIDGSSSVVMLALFQFTEPLKISLMKRLNIQANVIVPIVT